MTDPKVPACMKSLVNGAVAEKAYEGFLGLMDVVKESQVTSAAGPAPVPSGDTIGVVAQLPQQLSEASCPLLKEIGWLSDVCMKPLLGVSARQFLKAINKMIVMVHQAIGSIDATGVTSAADYVAVNATLGRVIASLPKSTVMDVYSAMAAVTDTVIPLNMF
eukprot:3948328-Amphidinium_carterae.1